MPKCKMRDSDAKPPNVSKAIPSTIKQTPSTILPTHCAHINVKQEMEKTYDHLMDPQDNSSSSNWIYFPLREYILLALESCLHALTIHQQSLINLDRSMCSLNCDKREYLDQLAKVKKLQTDGMYVRELLEDVKNELKNRGSFCALIKLIEESALREKEENDILLNCKETERVVTSARKILEDETIAHNHEIDALRAELVNLKNTKKKFKLKADVAMRYTNAWETAQCEQSSLQCSIILKGLNTHLHDCLIREKNERRVAREIGAFLTQNITFNEQATLHWRERYNCEMQLYDIKNNELRKDIETRRSTLEILNAKYRERQEFIDGYLAEKEVTRLKKKHEEHRYDCAIKIESWWRGVMVRRKLGPYRTDEKKKKRTTKTKK